MLLEMHITRDYENHTVRLSETHYIRQILISSIWRMWILCRCLWIQTDQRTKRDTIRDLYIGKLLGATYAMQPDISRYPICDRNDSARGLDRSKENIEIF
ncbi:hypothetical protein PILCRDRAFT_827367 [Piloderma croceum F 1598]|uniref:Uncharacterized protein n=1 Tax=Piloderma croceum (strain F 1598) TaxID=765440 RepID=A0A0C3BDA4_PILCF|nr:hypothetical protein PILCRDRAFT_827367 [Piloderma croceum F 1598]